jgi:hypothetical protein
MTINDEISDLFTNMSVQDMRDLAFEMYQIGEPINDLVELIHQKDMQDKKNTEL